MKMGKVWLVGAGPGNRSLLTEKGKECLAHADVVVYDLLACPSILNGVPDGCELIFAGKQSGHHFKKQSETNLLLAELAMQGKQVVRLKGGDPFIFGRGGEEAQVLREHGVPFEIVPGVSSCYSAAAYAGIPITHRDYASSFHVITGHKKTDNVVEPDFATLARESGTQVYLMSLQNLPHITEQLIANGKSPETPAAVIQQGTTSHQRVAVGNLKNIAAEATRQQLHTPALTVIGDVVSLREQLQWFEKGDLFGKKIIVTGTKQHAAKTAGILREYGADAAEMSLLRIKAADAAVLSHVDWNRFTWIVFTSANGVELFFAQLRKTKTDIRRLMHLQYAAIGSGTAEALEQHGIYVDVIPEKYESRYLAEALIPRLGEQDRVLMMRAENGTTVLQELLTAAGKAFETVALYRTETDDSKKELLQLHWKDADYVVFASASAVYAFHELTQNSAMGTAKFVSIGSVTGAAAQKLGIPIACTAETATAEGLAEAIRKDVMCGKDV